MNNISIFAIDANGDAHTIEDWAKVENPALAVAVAFELGHTSLRIEKHDIEDGKSFTFDDAQTKCAELGEGFRCPTTHEALDMYKARFIGLDDAFKLIGGTPVCKGYRWTCEADPDPEYNSSNAFVYYGYTGNVYYSNKYYAYSVRPVSAFKK